MSRSRSCSASAGFTLRSSRRSGTGERGSAAVAERCVVAGLPSQHAQKAIGKAYDPAGLATTAREDSAAVRRHVGTHEPPREESADDRIQL